MHLAAEENSRDIKSIIFCLQPPGAPTEEATNEISAIPVSTYDTHTSSAPRSLGFESLKRRNVGSLLSTYENRRLRHAVH